jgi:hypothetical protein
LAAESTADDEGASTVPAEVETLSDMPKVVAFDFDNVHHRDTRPPKQLEFIKKGGSKAPKSD